MNYEFDVALRIQMTKETLSHLMDNASHCLDKLTACDTTRGRWMPSTLQMITHALCIGSPRPVNYEMAAIFDMPLVERQLTDRNHDDLHPSRSGHPRRIAMRSDKEVSRVLQTVTMQRVPVLRLVNIITIPFPASKSTG